MKIVTWNCRGAFWKKFELLDEFDADVVVVQECENPAMSKNEGFRKWCSDYIWVGDNKNKGLGVFAKKSNKIVDNQWPSGETKYFISFRINDCYDFVATWCHGANSPTFGYIGQLWKYMQLNKDVFPKLSMLIGDFNSNKIWDKWDRWWNHSDVVRELEGYGIISIYHRFYNELQGEETRPTYFHYLNLQKPYHIDYIFARRDKDVKNFMIGDSLKWIQYSDHLPLYCEID